MKTTVRTEPPVTGEQAPADTNPAAPESLAALAAEGATVDSGGTPGQPDAPKVTAEPVPDKAAAKDLADMLKAVRDMAAPGLEEMKVMKPGQVAAIWTDSTVERIASPLAAIMNRHNMGIDELMEKFGPYIMLGMAIAGPSMATFRAVRLNAAEAKTPPAAAPDAKQQ